MFVLELISELVQKLKPARRARRSKKREVGDRAEAFALEFLQREHGFKLIGQSISDEAGELDLVGRMKGFEGVVVVEVRARREGGMLKPDEAVDQAKQRQVVETAQRVLRRRGIVDLLRYDIVGVYLDEQSNPLRAEHFPDAFNRSVLRTRRRN